jgi:hypothetical protein
MQINFYCPDLTCLRYLMPIARRIGSHDIQIDSKPFNDKYNGLGNSNNKDVFEYIVTAFTPNAKIKYLKVNEKVECDVLFSVEHLNIRDYTFKKHFAIQHGFDCMNFFENMSKDTVYIAHSEFYANWMKNVFDINAIYTEVPITFWDIKEQPDSKKIMCIFYPEKHYRSAAHEIITHAETCGYTCMIKQRAKNQAVPSAYTHRVYDRIWYPSEAILLPAISDIVLGIGTSAYADIAEVGINYIDAAIPDYSKKENYPKPFHLDNFFYVEEDYVKNIINVINEIAYNKLDFSNHVYYGNQYIKKLLDSV